jgi:hypothetical protein
MGVTVDLCACRFPGSINAADVSATNSVEMKTAGVTYGGVCGDNKINRIVGYRGRS